MTSDDIDEVHFDVMSTHAHIVVVGGGAGVAARARQRVEALEARWTRFAPSEITYLNARTGEVVVLSPETYALVEAAVTAWRATGGKFDPTVLTSMVALGYDRSFELLGSDHSEAADTGAGSIGSAPGFGGALLWPERREVLLPAGAEIDPGGIGKGLAADLVVDELIASGVEGVVVNLGGDTRVGGRSPDGGRWPISIEDPRDGQEFARVALDDGAVATSSTLTRHWTHGGREHHHVLDPSTGSPAATDAVAVSVVAGRCWWAEATTKWLLVEGPGGLEGIVQASAIVFLADGTFVASPALEEAIIR